MKHIVLLLVSLFTSVIIYGQTTVSFNYDGSGNRTSRRTISLLKSTASTQDEIASPESSSEQLGNRRILIYPNPVESEITVSIEGKDEKSLVVISIYDQSGRLMLNDNSATELNVLNLSHFPAGNYFMNIRIGNDLTQWKIVKD
jgi:hypothetical protein